MKLLIVEDNVQIAELLVEMVQKWGYGYKWVNTVNAALDCVAQECFDIALVDIVLPDHPGYETIPEIKKRCPHTAIVVMTGQNSVDLKQKIQAFGIAAFIQKPFAPTEIKAVLDSVRPKNETRAAK